MDRQKLNETMTKDQADQMISDHTAVSTRGATTMLNVTNAERGAFTETVLRSKGTVGIQEQDVPYPRDFRGRMTLDESMVFTEAARGRATTSNFADLLRSGIVFDVFTGFNGVPLVGALLTNGEVPSMKQQEEYVKDAGVGIAPVVHEGDEYPEAAMDLSDSVIVRNDKRGFKLPVTEEMRMFDQLGKIRSLAQLFGRALAITQEVSVMDVLTTTGNYTRTEAAGDNDEGNNTQNLTLSAAGLETALNVMLTSKDNKSGMYLGVAPRIMFCAPKALGYVKRLIQSTTLVRTHGATTAEVDGIGQDNPFFGIVDTIVSSPYIGKEFEWGLLDTSGTPIVFQRVLPVEVRGPVFNESNDTFWFYPRTYYGVGMKDDRFGFFSNSTTRPTVS